MRWRTVPGLERIWTDVTSLATALAVHCRHFHVRLALILSSALDSFSPHGRIFKCVNSACLIIALKNKVCKHNLLQAKLHGTETKCVIYNLKLLSLLSDGDVSWSSHGKYADPTTEHWLNLQVRYVNYTTAWAEYKASTNLKSIIIQPIFLHLSVRRWRTPAILILAIKIFGT